MVGMAWQQGCEEAGYIVSAVWRQNTMNAGTFSFNFSFYSDWNLNPWDNAPHIQGGGFSTQLNISVSVHIDMSKCLFPRQSKFSQVDGEDWPSHLYSLWIWYLNIPL